jgi:hypothetical protein
MANTNIEATYPEFWASSFDELDIGEYDLHNQVNRDYSQAIQTAGDTVTIPITPDFGDADDYDSEDNSGGDQSIAQETAQITLDFSKKKSFTLTAKQLSLSAYDLVTEYGQPAMRSLIRSLNSYIYQKMLLSNYIIDARSAFDEDKIVDAKTLLDKNEVSPINRSLVAGPDDYGAMVKLAKFSDADTSGDSTTLQEGRLPRRYGFALGMNNIIDTYTPGDVTGAINNVANYTGADYTIAVDAFNDDSNPIRVGDIFTVASESNSPLHTVQSTTKTTGDTTGITFLTKHNNTNGSKSNDAVVTVIPTRSILAFARSGVGLAIRTYGVLPESGGVRSIVANFRGMPVRISTWHKDLNWRVQFDVLGGATIVNRKRVVRIIR